MACGIGLGSVQSVGGEGISYPSEDGHKFTWPGRSNVEGGDYSLCWCRPTPGGLSCRGPGDFLVQAGSLRIEGPRLSQLHHCTSTEACSLELLWPDAIVPRAGALLAIEDGSECGGDHVVVARGFGGGEPAEGTVRFEWPTLAVNGGRFGLCWCSAPWYEPQGCSDVSKFYLRVGDIEVSGPYRNQSFSCYQGEACRIRPVLGLHLRNGPALLLRFGGAGSCADAARAASNGTDGAGAALALSSRAHSCDAYFDGCTVEWGADVMTMAPGHYQLCWCASPDRPFEDFSIDVGTLTVVAW
eukprot:TRINITY_DN21727_c1_g1_i3.p1 TRINITY_DN21727_c1_g1~~TRINITY_DN21727_c1_g1_i3.p1  ORF type:complete len:299 (-),score=63.87 TRINITY_DN21727_c1_g1_i3:132-1028(-)